jgi:hypothetical protein
LGAEATTTGPQNSAELIIAKINRVGNDFRPRSVQRFMDKAKEYRANAAAAMKLAARSDDDDVKAAILSVAQGWLELAERAEKRDP